MININRLKKIIQNIFLIVIIIVLLLAFSSSYTSFSIDNLAFVIAIAVDKGSNDNNLQFTFQIAKPSVLSDSGSSSENNAYVINSVETSSISTAINLMNSYIGKELNFSHCKLIVFSEELAISGLSNHIYTLMNNNQIRPYTNLVVSKTEAKYYIENSKPSLEILPSKYYEIFPNSSRYTGYTANATIGYFFNNMKSNTSEAYAILGGTIDSNSDNLKNYSSEAPLNYGNIKSNETTISGKRGTENIGLAVFKGDQLVGELNAIETICFSVIQNQVDAFLITIKDIEDNENYIDIYLYNEENSKIKVDIVNGNPYITINCKLNGRIYSMKDNSNYLDDTTLQKISDSASDFMKIQMSNYLYKTSKEFKSDINNFGKNSLSNFTTVDEFKKYNWLYNYENSFFNINVDISVKSGFLIVES